MSRVLLVEKDFYESIATVCRRKNFEPLHELYKPVKTLQTFQKTHFNYAKPAFLNSEKIDLINTQNPSGKLA